MEVLFNSFKVKFNKLAELMSANKDVTVNTDDTVRVFINLETILIKMCTPKVLQYISVNKNCTKEFVSNVINLTAHYRLFFNKYKIKNQVYLYMSSIDISEYKNSSYNKDYRMYYRYKFQNAENAPIYKIIQDGLPFIKLILECVEGVYFIESDKMESSLIPYIINAESDDKDVRNFIVTGDLYDLQYINHGYHIILPKGENSFICTKSNIIQYLVNLYQCKGTYTLSSKFLPFILSIIGSKYRNIYNIKGLGLKTTFKIIQKALNDKLISNNIDSIYLLLEIVKPNLRDHIVNNYHCVDLDYQYTQLTKKDVYVIMSVIRDKYDNVALKKINDTYFAEYPLMIQELMPLKKVNNIKF